MLTGLKNLVSGNKKLVVLTIVVIAVIAFFIINTKSAAPKYESHQAKKILFKESLKATGSILPQNRLTIKSPVAGRLEKLFYKEGNKVRKKSVIGYVSSTERITLIDAAEALEGEKSKEWEEVYKPTPLISPISGTLIARLIEPGQTVTTQDVIAVISNKLMCRAEVDETDVAKIRVGLNAQIILDAYSDTKIDAKVAHIAFEARTVNNVTIYDVDVVPNEISDFMRSGMTAEVEFLLSEPKEEIAIPSDAIQYEENKTFVLTKDKGKVVKKEIVIGGTDCGKTKVLSGINEGEEILIPIFLSEKKETSGKNPFMPDRSKFFPKKSAK